MKDMSKLLDITSSSHGFWLINHRELINSDLMDAIKNYGVDGAAKLLANPDDKLTTSILAKIKAYREAL